LLGQLIVDGDQKGNKGKPKNIMSNRFRPEALKILKNTGDHEPELYGDLTKQATLLPEICVCVYLWLEFALVRVIRG
jgi:hypothetical protein